MTLDVAELREATPGCANVIHLNNAGAALMPAPVLDAVQNHLDLESQRGGYEAAAMREPELELGYDIAAKLLNASRSEIAFVENATRAWDMAFYSIPFKEGDRILTAQSEYVSNYLAYLQMEKRRGVRIEVIPNDEHGQVSVTALEKLLDDKVRLVSITHVPTSGGLINPAAEIGKLTRESGTLFLLDACQSAGQMPLDVKAIGCDMLSATGRKFLRGPRGTGFLYVRQGIIDSLEPPFIDLHSATWSSINEYRFRSDARRFENWETNVAGKLGLAKALEYAENLGIHEIWFRIQELAEQLRGRLGEIRGVHVADAGRNRCGIVTFHVDDKAPKTIVESLRRANINTSSVDIPSARLDLESRRLPALVRASVHYYNKESELDLACAAIADLANAR